MFADDTKSFELKMITLHCFKDSHSSGIWNLMFLNANFTLVQPTTMVNRTLIDTTETLVLFLMISLNFTFTRLMLPLKLIEFLDWFKDLWLYHANLLFKTLVIDLSWNTIYNSIWGPHYILDKKKVEKVQRRATHLLPQFHDNSYTERLTLLSLPSLHYKQLRGDLIFPFKILNNYFTTDFSLLIYMCTQDLLPGGISSNCLRSAAGYWCTFLIIYGTVYHIMLLILSSSINTLRHWLIVI